MRDVRLAARDLQPKQQPVVLIYKFLPHGEPHGAPQNEDTEKTMTATAFWSVSQSMTDDCASILGKQYSAN